MQVNTQPPALNLDLQRGQSPQSPQSQGQYPGFNGVTQNQNPQNQMNLGTQQCSQQPPGQGAYQQSNVTTAQPQTYVQQPPAQGQPEQAQEQQEQQQTQQADPETSNPSDSPASDSKGSVWSGGLTRAIFSNSNKAERDALAAEKEQQQSPAQNEQQQQSVPDQQPQGEGQQIPVSPHSPQQPPVTPQYQTPDTQQGTLGTTAPQHQSGTAITQKTEQAIAGLDQALQSSDPSDVVAKSDRVSQSVIDSHVDKLGSMSRSVEELVALKKQPTTTPAAEQSAMTSPATGSATPSTGSATPSTGSATPSTGTTTPPAAEPQAATPPNSIKDALHHAIDEAFVSVEQHYASGNADANSTALHERLSERDDGAS